MMPAETSQAGSLSYDRYYLKAMNCPHHHKLFAAVSRSYRDLPLRLAEYGTEKYLMRFSTHDPSKLGQKFVKTRALETNRRDDATRIERLRN